jgi:hypothetical protein
LRFRDGDLCETSHAKLVRVTREEVFLASVDIIAVLLVVGERDTTRTLRSKGNLRGSLGKGINSLNGLLNPGIVIREQRLHPHLVRVDINNDRAVNPNEGEIGVVGSTVTLLPGHTNTKSAKPSFVGQVSSETTPEWNGAITALNLTSLTVLVEEVPDIFASEVMALLGVTSGNLNEVLVDEMGEVGAGVVQATEHGELTRARSTVKEDKALRVIARTEVFGEGEGVNVGDIDGRVNDLAKGFVEGEGGVTLRNTRPDVGVGEFDGSLGLERRAVSRVPVLSELPEVLEDLQTPFISQDGLGVVLDSPERLRTVTDTHTNMAIVLILRPGQLLDLSTSLEGDMKRVVTDDLDIGKTSEDLLAVMVNDRDLTVLHGLETVDGGTMLDTQTLLSQADTENRDHVLLGDFP